MTFFRHRFVFPGAAQRAAVGGGCRGRLLGAACAAAAGLALTLLAPGPAARAAALTVTEIAPGVYLHQGEPEQSQDAPLEDVANIGFVVGARSVAVIDTGGSHRVGAALREAVRAVTDKPVGHVILTHVHNDHVLGAAAFAPDRPQVIGHARLPGALVQRGQFYLDGLRRALGEQAAGTRVVAPTRTVADVLELDLGGRVLVLRAHRTAHTDNDLSVYDRQTRTLWLSDLLFRGRVPALDGSVLGWLEVMDALARVPAARVVPGHGPPATDWPAALAPQRRYLQGMVDEVRAALRARVPLRRAVERVGLGERRHWLLFDWYHRRNVTAAFVELEWE